MKKTIILCLFLLLIIGCSKDENSDGQTTEIDAELNVEALTAEENAFWESQENIELSSGSIVLPNGTNLDEYMLEIDPDFHNNWSSKNSSKSKINFDLQDSKNKLIGRMSEVVISLLNRDNFKKDKGGIDKPEQYGLAYSYGTRKYDLRQKPPSGECTAEVYGLDCSGLVYQIFLHSGVLFTLPTYAEKQRTPKTIEDAIKAAFPEMDKIKVEDLSKISPDKFENGDIIYWKNEKGIAKHIGIILKKTDGTLAIAQSNGTDKKSDDCEKNIGLNRGPRFSPINKAILPIGKPDYGFGTNYGIVRINADVSSPKLTTAAVISITSTSAISGGSISRNGGSPITEKGVCWNTSQNPTIANNKTDFGAGNDSFISNLTGLNENTTYYVRAYATNSLGAAYGNEISFKTLQNLPPEFTKLIGHYEGTHTLKDFNISPGNDSSMDMVLDIFLQNESLVGSLYYDSSYKNETYLNIGGSNISFGWTKNSPWDYKGVFNLLDLPITIEGTGVVGWLNVFQQPGTGPFKLTKKR